MIPDSAGALLAFLGLIAPGLIFSLRRQRRRPQDTETTLQEAGRIALTSLIFTVLAILVLLPLTAVWSALPDPARWAADPNGYAKQHYAAVGWFLLLELATACALAYVLESVTGQSLRGNIVPGGIWYAVLRRDVPVGTRRVWLRIATDGGAQFKGPLRGYTPAAGDEGAGIALGGEPILWLPPAGDPTDASAWTTLDRVDAVVIAATEIRHVVVSYLDEHGNSLAAAPPPTSRLGAMLSNWSAFRTGTRQ
jgi:hypothetical protein